MSMPEDFSSAPALPPGGPRAAMPAGRGAATPLAARGAGAERAGPSHSALRAYLGLCKPRVNSLIVFTACAGMVLASPAALPWARVAVAALGIALCAFAAAALNCLFEQGIDARMVRTRHRAVWLAALAPGDVLMVSLVLGGTGLWLLAALINPLTAALTFATLVGYAGVYTLLLKPATPFSIVIGGAAGAMPPVLGWTAMTGALSAEALALFLIIFLWTPPHFWALACYRRYDYARSGLPMLPVTHGLTFTSRHILLYVVMLAAASLLPVSLGMSGPRYLAVAALLGAGFLAFAIALCQRYSDGRAKACFRYSLLYLSLLFAALLIDRGSPA